MRKQKSRIERLQHFAQQKNQHSLDKLMLEGPAWIYLKASGAQEAQNAKGQEGSKSEVPIKK